MNETEIIIVGAGAAGLICARELAHAGKKPIVLEARSRMGGRIHTVADDHFPLPVELGAEFIHGDLPVTKNLLQEAAIEFYKIKGTAWRSENGHFIQEDDLLEDMDLVIQQLKKLPADLSIAVFLDQYFPGEKYAGLRKTLKNYVEGYDAADTSLASSFAFLEELLAEDDAQYRIKGGYTKLIEYLFEECTKAGCNFLLETVVKEIRWKPGHVEAITHNNNVFAAKKIIVTVPLGILQSSNKSTGHIIFSPALQAVQKSINELGYGTVIKIILNFKNIIWEPALNSQANKKSQPGFLFSDAIIPTWWTQLPEKNGMLTGWLAGPKAARLETESDEHLLDLSLESLAAIFQIPRTTLKNELKAWRIHNWSKDEFSAGAYAYETVHSKNARHIMKQGVNNTIYFAGEACYEGAARGTVEAALATGQELARMLVKEAES